MRRSYVLLVLVYCAGIWWLSSQSRPPKPDFVFPGNDKAGHAVLFAGLAVLVAVGVRRAERPWGAAAQFWAPILFAALYGAVDEFHQTFVPQRTSSVFDWMADVTGALVVQGVMLVYAHRLRLRPR